MSTRDHLIRSLKALCQQHGGYRVVADRIGVDDQSLYQIISGVKLPSGNAKGVGPTIQRKLDDAFPGWADLPPTSASHAGEERATYNVGWPFRKLQPAALRAVSETQLDALEQVLSAALSGMTPSTQWREIAHTLAGSLDRELGRDVYTDFVRKVDELANTNRTAAGTARAVLTS